MRQMMLGIVVTVFACGEYFILESNTQEDANHSPLVKPAGVAGLEMSAKIVATKDGRFTLVVRAKNPGKVFGKKSVRILFQETNTNSFSRMIPRPVVAWEKEIEVDLAAGDEKSFEFSDPRFASLANGSGGATGVLAEVVVVSGKARATLMANNVVAFNGALAVARRTGQ